MPQSRRRRRHRHGAPPGAEEEEPRGADLHDPEAAFVADVLGSYLTDVFFNHVWASARKCAGSRAPVADEFVRQAQAFVVGVKSDAKSFGDVAARAWGYYRSATSHAADSYAEFVARCARAVLPPAAAQRLGTADVDEVFAGVFCDLAANLAAFFTSPGPLARTTGAGRDRDAPATIAAAQREGVRIVLAKRADLFNRFLRSASQAAPPGDARETLVVEDLKRAVRALAREKLDALAEGRALRAKLAAAREEALKLRKLVELMRVVHGGRRPADPAALVDAVAAARRPTDVLALAGPRPGRGRHAARSSDGSESESESGSESESESESGSGSESGSESGSGSESSASYTPRGHRRAGAPLQKPPRSKEGSRHDGRPEAPRGKTRADGGGAPPPSSRKEPEPAGRPSAAETPPQSSAADETAGSAFRDLYDSISACDY